MGLLTPEGGYQLPGAIVFDGEFSGAEVSFGKDLKAVLQAGRVSTVSYQDDNDTPMKTLGDTANYQGISVQYDKDKFVAGVGYYNFGSDDFKALTKNHKGKMGIWSANLGYRFDKNNVLSGAYAHNSKLDADDSSDKKSYQVTYAYKGADAKDQGSWGAYLSYRYLDGASLKATQDGALFLTKGIEVGANYTAFKNVVLSAKYFNGKDISKDDGKDKVQHLFGRVEFLF